MAGDCVPCGPLIRYRARLRLRRSSQARPATSAAPARTTYGRRSGPGPFEAAGILAGPGRIVALATSNAAQQHGGPVTTEDVQAAVEEFDLR